MRLYSWLYTVNNVTETLGSERQPLPALMTSEKLWYFMILFSSPRIFEFTYSLGKVVWYNNVIFISQCLVNSHNGT